MLSRDIVYVDTSALARLLVDSGETEDLIAWLDHTISDLVSSELLEVELRRVALREGLHHSDVSALLDGVSLAGLDRAVVRSAGLLPMPYLRTLDALHLESALRLNATALLTYDKAMADAGRELGIEIVAPGASI